MFFVYEILVRVFFHFSIGFLVFTPQLSSSHTRGILALCSICYIFFKFGSSLLTLFMVFFCHAKFLCCQLYQSFSFITSGFKLYLESFSPYQGLYVSFFTFRSLDPFGVYSFVQCHTKFPYVFESNWIFSSICLFMSQYPLF